MISFTHERPFSYQCRAKRAPLMRVIKYRIVVNVYVITGVAGAKSKNSVWQVTRTHLSTLVVLMLRKACAPRGFTTTVYPYTLSLEDEDDEVRLRIVLRVKGYR